MDDVLKCLAATITQQNRPALVQFTGVLLGKHPIQLSQASVYEQPLGMTQSYNYLNLSFDSNSEIIVPSFLSGSLSVYVTGPGKTGLMCTFCISRNTNLKY